MTEAQDIDKKIDTVELDDDLVDPLIRLYVLKHLSENAKLDFVDSLNNGATLYDALASAIVTEMANLAFAEIMEAEEKQE